LHRVETRARGKFGGIDINGIDLAGERFCQCHI